MKFTISDFFLEFKTPFSIAHGTRIGTDIVFVEIEHEGISAIGEASLPPYLDESPETVRSFIHSFLSEEFDLFNDLSASLEFLLNYKSKNYAAKACIDIALHNWFAAKNKVAVYELLGLKATSNPICTFTIGMDNEKNLEQKIRDANDFHVLKIKLGGENDKQQVDIIRKFTDKPICVDANQGWKNREYALEMITWLNERNTLFIEQPLDKKNTNDQFWLFERSPLPIYADESVQVPDDIEKIRDRFHGINIKLMKCGGISEAMKMISMARKNKLSVLIGSMAETGCAIKAASQLSSLADMVDLDGPLLTKNNPFDTVFYENGKLIID